MRSLLRLLLWSAGVLGGLGLLLYAAQRRLLYFPERQDREEAVRQARRLGLDPWLDEKGGFLGWRSAHPGGRADGRLLVLHGNAGMALHRTYLRDAFQAPGLPAALDVFLLEYPGYGPRPGSPSEPALVAAAVEVLDRLGHGESGPLLVAGESLGSAVGALASARRPGAVAGLLLVTPLASVPAVARRHYPFLPAFLLRDRLRTDQALPRYGGPVAFLVAGRDSIVFPDLGEALYRDYPGPKRLWVDGPADHNTLDYDPSLPRWAEMLGFLLAPAVTDR